MTNTCKVCGVTSDAAEFYKTVTSRCKECHKEKVRENRAARVDYYRAYDARRYQEDPRVKERHKRYNATPEGIAAMRRAQKKWLRKNPEKRAAHCILNNAIRDGRVKKSKTCQLCGAGGCRIDGHHEDYSKPLDVIWLCRNCHVQIHKYDQ